MKTRFKRCISILLCVTTISMLVLSPVGTQRAKAFAGTSTVFIIAWAIFASLGMSMTLNPDHTLALGGKIEDLGHDFLDFLSDAGKHAVNEWALLFEGNWDATGMSQQIGINRQDWANVCAEVVDWVSGKDTVDFTSVQTIKSTTPGLAAYHNTDVDAGMWCISPLDSPVGKTTYRHQGMSTNSARDIITYEQEYTFTGTSLSFRQRYFYEDHWSSWLVRGPFACTAFGIRPREFAPYVDVSSWYGDLDDSGNWAAAPTRVVAYSNSFREVYLEHPICAPLVKSEVFTYDKVYDAWSDVVAVEGIGSDVLPFTFPMTIGDVPVSADGTITLNPTDVLPRELVDALDRPISKPGEGTGEGTGDVVIEDVALPTVSELKLSQAVITKFPFCIPFDLYKGAQLLAADPIRPVFTIPLKYGDIMDEEIVLDLSKLDSVIVVIRWFELLLFMAGLAYATRNLIKW